MKEARKVVGWTQEQLADSLRAQGLETMAKAVVSAIERGERRVTVEEALTIALVLNVAPANLLTPFGGPLTVGDVEMEPQEAWNWIKGKEHHHAARQHPDQRVFQVESVPPWERAALEQVKEETKPDIEAGRGLTRIAKKVPPRTLFRLELAIQAEFVTEGTVCGYVPPDDFFAHYSGGSAGDIHWSPIAKAKGGGSQ